MATNSTPSPAQNATPPHAEFLVGFICVLKEEYRAAMRILDERYDNAGLVRSRGDKNHYVIGRIGAHNVIFNVPPAETCGNLNAALIADAMKGTFPRMRFVLLVGIAGAAPSQKHDIRLGDVVLGTRVVPYGMGKQTDSGLQRTGLTQAPSAELRGMITFLYDRIWSEDVVLSESIEHMRTRTTRGGDAFRRPRHDRLYEQSFRHNNAGCDCLRPDSGLGMYECLRSNRDGDQARLFEGGIGSGDHVMKNAAIRDAIAGKEDILCYEMEASGVMRVTPCLPIRGISDYSDGHKNDDWQLYAALAAATCARELLLSISPQVVAALPLTLAGDELDRYVTGTTSNPSSFSGSEIERLRQTRDSLRERHILIGELMMSELLKLEDATPDDREETERRIERLKEFQATLKRHLQDLNRIVKQHDGLRLDENPDVRDQYQRLRDQVRSDTEVMEGLYNITEGGFQTTSKILGNLAIYCNDRRLGIARIVMTAISDYVGRFLGFLRSNGLSPVNIWRWMGRQYRAIFSPPVALGVVPESIQLMA